MGRSAKFHKRQKKAASTTPNPQQSKAPAATVQEQKKRAGLKAKAARRKDGSEGYVLGGADYVDILMGSRKKAKEEAAKLPKDMDQ